MRGFQNHPKLRVTALVMSSAAAGIRGLAYVDAPNTRFTTFIDAWIPLHLWAFVWFAAAALMLVGVWHRIVARWALSLGAALWGAWAISYALSWIVGGESRGWVTAGVFALAAGLTWIVAALADSAGPPPGPVIPDVDGFDE